MVDELGAGAYQAIPRTELGEIDLGASPAVTDGLEQCRIEPAKPRQGLGVYPSLLRLLA